MNKGDKVIVTSKRWTGALIGKSGVVTHVYRNGITNVRLDETGTITPVHPECRVEVVNSTHWLYPFRYLIQVTGSDGRSGYWSRA